MVSIAKLPALLLLAGTFFLTGSDPALAASATKRKNFNTFLVRTTRRAEAISLEKKSQQANATNHQVPGGQTLGPSTNIFKLVREDYRLKQETTRLMQQMQRLNSITPRNPRQANALDRFRQSLTARETTVTQQLQAVQRQERNAGTPSSPGR